MANEIDRRVTEMQFDNATFEQKIATTLTSLDKLQKSLDFSNSSKGMGDLQSAASKLDFAHLGAAVDTISSKFSALGITAITALTNITNKAVDAGIRMVKSLSTEPIMDGLREYETNMTSIQTILSNTKDKGGNLDTVNKALDQLNTYSDKTIYNFGQMARNIGTFTAAGVGLDESVKSIKGIANLAALSGSSSEQASTAMYQLSQALAAGKVNLMDWNSVVNAGMGGELFKKALFETGKAMKTITDVPLGASFEEWEKKGGTFREQMQNGWLTSDVLATTLQGLSGDLDKAGLKAIGFGDAAANKLVELGKMGEAAATEVKTFSQLMSTLKEGVGSGWAQSFRTIVGDFEQAKALFTEINKVVGGALGASADARNAMLKTWADFGGRTAFIDAARTALSALGDILRVVGDAFRSVFPPVTAATLLHLTAAFRDFASDLKLGVLKILPDLTRIFKGLFAGVEIVITIVKELGRFFIEMWKALVPDSSSGEALHFIADMSAKLIALNHVLVTEGGIRKFFYELAGLILNPKGALEQLKATFDRFIDAFPDWFSKFDNLDGALGRVQSRFGKMEEGVQKIKDVWSSFMDVMSRVKETLDTIWGYISTWFSELGDKISKVLQPGDFNAAVDVVNVGLVGGILLVIKRFTDKLLQFDFGGDFKDKINSIFDIINEKAKLMQTQIKADILLKIAGAIGILAASLTVMSLIDSVKLTSALVGMGAGVAIMVVAMKQLEGIGGVKGAGTIAILSGAMIAMSTALLILSGAVAVLGAMDIASLARGVGAITVMLTAMVTISSLIATNTKGMIAAGIAMNAMATALVILAAAVKAFSMISWDDMGRGLFGVATALGIVTVAMNLMPIGGTIAAGLAMIPLATGIGLLAGAVAAFSLLSWEQMGKGMFGLAVALGIIAVAMNLMPITLPITAAGLLMVSAALTIMAGAIILMSTMSLDEMARGLGTLAGMLLILSLGLIAMTGSLSGAAALVVAAGALTILTGVLLALSKLSIKELAIGLGAIAGVLAVLGISAALLTPVIPSLMSLAGAMALLGGSFALFGLGVVLVAKGFEILAKSGKAGAEAIVGILKVLIGAIPALFSSMVASLAEAAAEIAMALDLVLRTVTVIVGHIIDTIILLAPKIGQLFVTMLTIGLNSMIQLIPKFIELGFTLIKAVMQGWSDNIQDITDMAVNIIVTIVNAIAASAQMLVDAAVNLLGSFVLAITERMPDIVLMGLTLLLNFINGISENLNKIVEAVGMLIARFIWTAGTYMGQIIRVGGDMLIWLIHGFGSKVNEVITAGVDVILAFLQGLGSNAVRLAEGAAQVLIDFLNGMATAIRTKSAEIRKAGLNIADAILDGITGGLTDMAKLGKVVESAKNLAGKVVDGFKEVIPFASPSPLFIQIGKWIIDGLTIGLRNTRSSELAAGAGAERIVSVFTKTLEGIPDTLGELEEFNPTIVPVLDLTNVYSGAAKLDRLMRLSTISPEVSFDQARNVATTKELDQDVTDEPEWPRGDVIFNQNNYSPEALRTNDIYRNTRSQFARAKEELGIPS